MQIEEGKFYVTRAGKTVGPATRQTSAQWPWHIRGAGSYGDNGRFNGDFDDPMDLVSEKFVTPGDLPAPFEAEALTILMEEAFEILPFLGTRASKCIRFGLGEVQPGQTETNAQRLAAECGDIIAVVELLIERGAIDGNLVQATTEAKRAKLQKFMQQDPG